MNAETYQKNAGLSYRGLIQVQKGHLQCWQKLLKPEVFAKLETRIESLTPTLEQFIDSESQPDIPRGQSIYEELVNRIEQEID